MNNIITLTEYKYGVTNDINNRLYHYKNDYKHSNIELVKLWDNIKYPYLVEYGIKSHLYEDEYRLSRSEWIGNISNEIDFHIENLNEFILNHYNNYEYYGGMWDKYKKLKTGSIYLIKKIAYIKKVK